MTVKNRLRILTNKMEIKLREHLKREDECSPNFRKRITIVSTDNAPPTRIYLHESGLVEAFMPKRGNNSIDKEAELHAYDSIIGNLNLVRDCDYLIALVWGKECKKMIDLFGYSGVTQNWKDNPSVRAFLLEEGHYDGTNREITCGDGIIILGEEERYRRTTRNLDEFIRFPPQIKGLLFQ